MPETTAPSSAPGEPAPSSRPRLGIVVLVWAAVGILLAAALVSAIGAANREVYSASGLVRAYLTALAEHQPAAALALPGVDPERQRATADRELLRGSVLGELSGIRLTESDRGDGTRRVTASYYLDSVPRSSEFMIAQTDAWLGVFPGWRFATSPLAVVTVTVLHAQTFTLSGLTVDPRAAVAGRTPAPGGAGADGNESNGYGAEARYLMFAPARYAFGHTSKLLSAAPITAYPAPGSNGTRVGVDAKANDAFTGAVQQEVDRALAACATQRVLQPAGCPFGTEIDDRVEGAPSWTIVRYPTVHIVPGVTGWQTQPLVGVAQIQVNVRSLFDGSVAPVQRDERFTMNVDITIGVGEAIAISVH